MSTKHHHKSGTLQGVHTIDHGKITTITTTTTNTNNSPPPPLLPIITIHIINIHTKYQDNYADIHTNICTCTYIHTYVVHTLYIHILCTHICMTEVEWCMIWQLIVFRGWLRSWGVLVEEIVSLWQSLAVRDNTCQHWPEIGRKQRRGEGSVHSDIYTVT